MNFSRVHSAWLLIASLFAQEASAFAPTSQNTGFQRRVSAAKPLNLMNGDVATDILSNSATTAASHFNNLLIATIDADIANVPDNEFAPIFAGGIMVMFGGVMSALIVGLILESNNSYANVIADSYAQGAEDEEFWKGLSEEEKKKAQELLAKVKAANNGETVPAAAVAAAETAEALTSTASSSVAAEETPDVQPQEALAGSSKETATTGAGKDAGMFSDY